MSKLSSQELQSLIAETVKSVQPFMEEESAEKISEILELLTNETVADWDHNFKEEDFYPPTHSYDFFTREQTQNYTKRKSLGLTISDPDSANHTTTLSYQKLVRVTPKPPTPEKKTGLLSVIKNKLLKAQETQVEQPKPEQDEPLREDSLHINIGPMGVRISDTKIPMIGGGIRTVDYVLENGILTKRVNNEVVSATQINGREQE